MDFRSFASAESEEDGEADDDFFGLGLQFQQKKLPHKQLQQQQPPQKQLQQQQPPQQQQHPASAVQPCPNASGGSNVASPPSVRKAAVDILQANLYDFNRITQAQVHKLTDEEDREALRRQNSKLYLNYIFGRYLTSITEEEQRLWLEPLGAGAYRGPLDRLAFSDSPDQIVRFFLFNFFLFVRQLFVSQLGSLRFFEQDELMQRLYLALSSTLSNLPVGPRSKATIARTLLFYQVKY